MNASHAMDGWSCMAKGFHLTNAVQACLQPSLECLFASCPLHLPYLSYTVILLGLHRHLGESMISIPWTLEATRLLRAF